VRCPQRIYHQLRAVVTALCRRPTPANAPTERRGYSKSAETADATTLLALRLRDRFVEQLLRFVLA
jgi:hypothetical protein